MNVDAIIIGVMVMVGTDMVISVCVRNNLLFDWAMLDYCYFACLWIGEHGY
jgi:hypothetical protein